jgi:hypothetical protein
LNEIALAANLHPDRSGVAGLYAAAIGLVDTAGDEPVAIADDCADPELLKAIYDDHALAIDVRQGRCLSSTSQPSLMARMMVEAMVRPGGRVLEIGRGRVLREGTDVALLSFGAHLSECLLAAEDLAARGVSVTVADARFAKPLDTALIGQLARHHAAIITVEQGAGGGFGAQVLQHMANTGGLDHGLRLRTMTLPDRFIDQASPAAMYADAG